MNLFYQPLVSEGIYHLDESESRHLIKVLRRKPGDQIHVTDGKGNLYHATIDKADARTCTFRIQHTEVTAPRSFRIHIAISPLKNAERIEWFIEKATEFTVEEITIINCSRTEKHRFKTDRLHKIAVSAMKQSLNFRLPIINGPIDLDRFIVNRNEQTKFIAHVDSHNDKDLIKVAKSGESYLILIGPEGDFTDTEVGSCLQSEFTKVSLGPSRLRTETAGIAACHILNLVNTR
ncbi:MAG: 16S rRNA (uracil(1498)-N(3))-methyltransferase [Chryseolinea sp.]